MASLLLPAAGMWTTAPPVTTVGAWITCCWWACSWWACSTAFPPLPVPSSSSDVRKRRFDRRLNVLRRKPIIFSPRDSALINQGKRHRYRTAQEEGIQLFPRLSATKKGGVYRTEACNAEGTSRDTATCHELRSSWRTGEKTRAHLPEATGRYSGPFARLIFVSIKSNCALNELPLALTGVQIRLNDGALVPFCYWPKLMYLSGKSTRGTGQATCSAQALNLRATLKLFFPSSGRCARGSATCW